jgi:hypothetical protein
LAQSHASSAPAAPRHAAQQLDAQQLSARAKALGQLVSQRHLTQEEVRRHTHEISESALSQSRVMQSPNFTSTTAADLQRMAELYDAKFFDSNLLSLARQYGMSFRWSSRMTSAGGKTIRSTHRPRGSRKTEVSYEIALSATLLFQTFGDLERPIRVTGHNCTNRMQAMQRILEHELVHLAEMLVWDDSNCAAGRFQTIANRFFGHTEHKHDLVTQQERAAKKYNIRVGSMVSFAHDGRSYIGKVNRITRRATILVIDPGGQRYEDGKHYRKFYVPLAHLRPV